jgi:uncharacterized protein (DUF1501 family)
LQAIGAGTFGGAAIGAIGDGWFGEEIPEAWAGTPIGAHDGILVVITMYGGNDGLNTLVPYGNGRYYSTRSNIAIAQPQVLKLDAQVGLHPELTYLKSLWDAGQVAAVQGVGYPNPDLSHFSSMATWMSGKFSGGAPGTGWIGRWLDGQSGAGAELATASIATSVPLHMVGSVRRAVAISVDGDMFGTGAESQDRRMYDGVRAMAAAPAGRGAWHDMYATTMRRQLDLATDVAPVFATTLPGGELAGKLTMAARLINANIGLRVIDVGFDGFDNHDNEQGSHPALMRDLNAGLQSFYSTLRPENQTRVTLMTVSEFGRTLFSNDSGGTDHGTAAPLFVIGTNVRGGLYGAPPSLSVLDSDDRLVFTTDFRHVYGTVLDGWLGGGAGTILGGGYTNLGFFAAGPGDPAPGKPTPVVVAPSASSPSGLVPITPLRIFDTRDGTGGHSGALGAGETWTFSFKGKFDVPGDAVAVAFNLTSVDATAPTFVTVWPTGEPRPTTANLNPVPGMAVPNLVVARTGVDFSINLYNLAGGVHLVGDLVGYFRTGSDRGLVPLTPARLLDTRDGTGGFSAPVGPGQSIDLIVNGRGGVPDAATAVALNITVTEPTAASFLTVWPTGEAMPLAASINMVAGQTVSNLVLARVGADGKISLFNKFGASHVVVDVLGGFVSGAPGHYVALTPSRLLDTRDGTGAPNAPVDQTPLVVSPLGKNGVPPTGVSAVLLNLTAVRPTAGTFVTVYPNDGARPLAANLTAVAGQVIPNMIIARVGGDGAVAMYNYAGTVDLVADVMGYFTS